MKKQKTSYILVKYQARSPQPFRARKEIPYEIKLAAKLVLDEISFHSNKKRLENEINAAIDSGNREKFEKLSIAYQPFIKE